MGSDVDDIPIIVSSFLGLIGECFDHVYLLHRIRFHKNLFDTILIYTPLETFPICLDLNSPNYLCISLHHLSNFP